MTPTKRVANSSLREATILAQVSGSPSSGTQAARRGKCSSWPLTNCASHNGSFILKAVTCVGMSVTRMFLPCSLTLRAFRCVVMSVRRARRASRDDSSDDEGWRCSSAGRTHGTTWLLDSASDLRKSKANRCTVDLVNQYWLAIAVIAIWPKCLLLVRTFTRRRVISLVKPALFIGWGFAGRIAMLLRSKVAGRTLGLRGPGLARGPEVARPW